MSLELWKEKGTPLDRQRFTWQELAPEPYSKLNVDAFTRARVILMNGVEADAIRFSHVAARLNRGLVPVLANLRRIEQHQQTLVNWLHPADQTPLETTLAFEQTAVEVTASVAQHEPDAYLAQTYRLGMLEDFDHLYRFSALYDRLEGKDANAILQSYTDVLPGHPTSAEHRAPADDVRQAYDRKLAHPLSKLHARLILAGEQQTHDYYMTVGPMFADPLARQLYAEIASIEEQHVTQYGCLPDPDEHWLEKWLLHEAMEVYAYHSCAESESHPRIKPVWERFLDYELGHLQFVRRLFEDIEHRDAAEILPERLPAPIDFKSHREFVRRVLAREIDLRAVGSEILKKAEVPRDSPSIAYREQLSSAGSPSETVAAGWRWMPGTELTLGAVTPKRFGTVKEGLRS